MKEIIERYQTRDVPSKGTIKVDDNGPDAALVWFFRRNKPGSSQTFYRIPIAMVSRQPGTFAAQWFEGASKPVRRESYATLEELCAALDAAIDKL